MGENGTTWRAFATAVQEVQDAAEFERLMYGDDTRPSGDLLERAENFADFTAIGRALGTTDGDFSALNALRRDRAMARVTSRYPEIWARVKGETNG
jgi:hypothetical protein